MLKKARNFFHLGFSTYLYHPLLLRTKYAFCGSTNSFELFLFGSSVKRLNHRIKEHCILWQNCQEKNEFFWHYTLI